MSRYEKYYANQIGGNVSDYVYKRRIHFQRGRGLGNVFSSLLSFLRPYIVSGSKALGKEFFRSGTEILDNLGSQPIKELLKQQSSKSLNNLARLNGNFPKSVGKGIKRMTKVDNDFIMKVKRRKRGSTKSKASKKKLIRKKKSPKTKSVKAKQRKVKKKKSLKKASFLKKFLN